jgi:hypothetical protein
MYILKKIFKLIIVIFAVFGIFGYCEVIMRDFPLVFSHLNSLLAVLLGILVFTLFWMIYLSKRGHFWSTLEHELTHALFATFFLKKIHSISASRRKGGVISIEGGNTVIALSPYIFPLAPSVILLLLFILPEGFEIYMFFLLGFTYQFHLINLAKEFHLGQSDLQKSGTLFSVIIILFFNIIYFGLIISILDGELSSFYQFIWDGVRISVNYMALFISFLISQMNTVLTG